MIDTSLVEFPEEQLHEVLLPILRQLQQVVDYDAAFVVLNTEFGPHIVCGHDVSLDANPQALETFLAEPLLAQAKGVQQPRIFLDIHSASDRQYLRSLSLARAAITAPLVTRDRVLGGLALFKTEPNYYQPGDARLVMAFAGQTAAAIVNEQLQQQTQRFGAELSQRAERLAVINRISSAVSSTLDLDEILQTAVREMANIFHVKQTGIILFEPELSHGRVAAEFQETPDATGASVRIPLAGNPSLQRVMATKQPLAITDARNDPLAVAIRDVIEVRNIKSILIIPLVAKSKVIGTIGLDAIDTPRVFSADEIDLAQTIANQIAMAIENSRLYAETHQRMRELASLTEVSQALNEAADLETILDIVLREAFALNRSEEGSIILIDPPDGDQLRIVAERGLGAQVVEAFNSRPVSRYEGTYRRALGTGRIVEVADTAADPDFLDDVGSRARQVTNVPLIAERGPIGLIAVDGLPRDDTTRRLLVSLAGIAAIAIDRERLHQETAARLAEVSTLYTLSTQIASTLSTTSVLESIVSILRMTLDCRACSIFLIDRTGEYLQLEVASGPSVSWKGIARLKLGEGISGRVITERRSIYIADTRQEPGFIFFDPNIRSLLVVPLLVRGEVIGTLSIDDKEPNAFDQETRLLTIAASQAAVAIENAQLYESLRASYDQLEQAFDELRRLDNSKSELIQNISHELRTPLTFIRGYMELLQEGGLGALQDEQKQAVDIVTSKSLILSTLVDDIIAMLETGREQISTGPVPLDRVARFAIQAARASATEAELELVEEIPDGLPPVRGEMRRLGQVFDNLIQNAIKFSRPGGRITIRIVEEETEIRAEVHDNGIGIPSSELDRIFERFYQVNGTTKRHFRGTGLGLAIVKQIVETHGGQVGVHSKVGQGSVFFFTVPKAASKQP